jgi:hypothetical protein
VLGAEWPNSYSARHEGEGAVLLGPEGEVVARVGDHIIFAGGVVGPDGLKRPCGGVFRE